VNKYVALLAILLLACATNRQTQKAPYIHVAPPWEACADKVELESGLRYRDALAVLWAQDGTNGTAKLSVGSGAEIDFKEEALGFIWRGKLTPGRWELVFHYHGRDYKRVVRIYDCQTGIAPEWQGH